MKNPHLSEHVDALFHFFEAKIRPGIGAGIGVAVRAGQRAPSGDEHMNFCWRAENLAGLQIPELRVWQAKGCHKVFIDIGEHRWLFSGNDATKSFVTVTWLRHLFDPLTLL
jgi:hypothetical protein